MWPEAIGASFMNGRFTLLFGHILIVSLPRNLEFPHTHLLSLVFHSRHIYGSILFFWIVAEILAKRVRGLNVIASEASVLGSADLPLGRMYQSLWLLINMFGIASCTPL